MPALTEQRLRELLAPYLDGVVLPTGFHAKLSAYLELLLRWNARTNLTAVRDPEEIVQRQMGESLFAARLVAEGSSLLDFGSGAGFPGIPLQLARPSLQVTLAESQGKKAGFLREAVRVLEISAEVWPRRVESMPDGRMFDVVTLRAVDDSGRMLPLAGQRTNANGRLLVFSSAGGLVPPAPWWEKKSWAIPNSLGRLLELGRK